MTADVSRRLRFNGAGFTLLSESDAKKDFNLCQICSLEPTCMMTRRVNNIMAEFNISAPITECKVYRPKLVFRPPYLGLENSFNTMRIGKAWAARLPENTIVSLWNATSDSEIGIARVSRSFTGSYEEVAKEHARYNHMMLKQLEPDAPHLLHKVLTRCYGTTFFTPQRQVSVIYLERVDEDRNQTPANQEG